LTQNSADDQMPYWIPSTGMANPTSENCDKQGVKLVMEERGEMGDFGVCYFEDNRHCEEWDPFRGEYATIGNSGADNEQEACTFKTGMSCDVWNATTASTARTSNPLVDTLLSLMGD
jgi:putative hemolysin